jgi:hypothetical protein
MAPKKNIQEKNENSNEITESTNVVIEPKPKRKPRVPKEDKEDKPKPKAKGRAKKVKESTESTNNSNDEESDKEIIEKQVKKQTRKPKEETVDKPKVTRTRKKNDLSILTDINNIQELNQDNINKMFSEVKQRLLDEKSQEEFHYEKTLEHRKNQEIISNKFLESLSNLSQQLKDSNDTTSSSSSSCIPVTKTVIDTSLPTIDENQMKTVNIDKIDINSENTNESDSNISDTESLMSD